ncbi:MAG: cytochrome c oxidase accessory protein CcoG [Bacteroidota bacterium]
MVQQFIELDDLGILESPEEVLSTLNRDGSRRWMYPVPAKGRHWRQRLWVGWALIAFFVLLPIVPINGRPAVFLNVMDREFALFGGVFYPTDTLLLLILGVASMVAIVLLTALLGRVWCGWACPQTVYLEFVYRPIERWIEGKEHIRKRRNEGPWTFDKVWRKGVKLVLFTLISAFLAHTFVAYFAGWENLLAWMQRPPNEQWGFFILMGGTTGLMLFNFGYFREQMCTITCPYARFQSVLLDPDSLIVSYDPVRGEPRARRSKKKLRQEAEGLIPAQGDCIDCGACVRTCPTGIDIRDGLQMECIACTQCIDACDAIMDKIGLEPGLIRYTSERELEGKRTRRVRPRTMLYGALMTALVVAFVALLATQGTYEIHVGRAVGEPFMALPDGRIANRLQFRVHNQSSTPVTFTLEAVQPLGTQINVVGPPETELEALEMGRVEAWIMVTPETFGEADTQEAQFRLHFSDGTQHDVTFPLLGPSQR